MRKLKLTHEEIEILQRALAIAENKFYEIRSSYIRETINLRGTSKDELMKETDIFFEKENEFCDLLLSIKNGEKDI